MRGPIRESEPVETPPHRAEFWFSRVPRGPLPAIPESSPGRAREAVPLGNRGKQWPHTGATLFRRAFARLLLAALLVLDVCAARADDFYRGKTVTLFAGQPPGGGIDSEMRLVARFLGKFIPGEPSILPMNMQGAGGIILGNHLYGVAKPDGLTLGMPGRTGFALAPVISAADTKYDLRKFTWIGSSASSNFVLWMRREANVRSFEDLRNAKRPIVIASSGSTTANSIMPEVLARYEKLPLKVVRGYPGINDAILAVERGEADGVLCQKASLRSDMIASGAIVPVFQVMAIEPDIALLDGLVTDGREKALLEMLSAPQRLGLPLIAPPGVPDDRTQILRRSYLAMVASADYQVEAMKRGLDMGQPNTGEELAQFVATRLAAFPAETIEEYRRYVERQ
jgi:tripartite-type tricarboxylate transporter receptor subunit TctC